MPQKYDDNGNPISAARYDDNGNPINAKSAGQTFADTVKGDTYTGPDTFWGGVVNSLRPGGEVEDAMHKGLTGFAKGAVLDIPSSIWSGVGSAFSALSDPIGTIQGIPQGLKNIAGNISDVTSRAGGEPEQFGRMMGQMTGQPAVTYGLSKAIPKYAPPAVKALGTPVEATGRIMREHQPVSGILPHMIEGRTMRNIEKFAGGGVEKVGKAMKNVSQGVKQGQIVSDIYPAMEGEFSEVPPTPQAQLPSNQPQLPPSGTSFYNPSSFADEVTGATQMMTEEDAINSAFSKGLINQDVAEELLRSNQERLARESIGRDPVTGIKETSYQPQPAAEFDPATLGFEGTSTTELPPPKPPVIPGDVNPIYNIEGQTYKPKFSNDLDKALFIIGKKGTIKDADYLKFVMTETGLDEAAARELGAEVRGRVRRRLAGQPSGEVPIPPIHDTKAELTPAQIEMDKRSLAARTSRTTQTTGDRWRAIVQELDAEGAPDTKYRDILSTGSKANLKKGETWRSRVLKYADMDDARKK